MNVAKPVIAVFETAADCHFKNLSSLRERRALMVTGPYDVNKLRKLDNTIDAVRALYEAAYATVTALREYSLLLTALEA